MTTETNKPFLTVRMGRINAAIWRNETESGARFNVTLERLYRDSEGNWKSTASLGREDLLLAAKVLDRAHSQILEIPAEA